MDARESRLTRAKACCRPTVREPLWVQLSRIEDPIEVPPRRVDRRLSGPLRRQMSDKPKL